MGGEILGNEKMLIRGPDVGRLADGIEHTGVVVRMWLFLDRIK